jgi:thiamine pyrophosphate-dependent acetolactate synthase large subunit-like protein
VVHRRERAEHDWPADAGRTARADAVRRLAAAAVAGPGLLAPQQVVATARACAPPETIATVDAGAHMLIKIKQKPAGHGGDEAVRYRPVSFAAAATAMGAGGAAVSTERELAAALADALARAGPTVIDAHVDPAGYPAIMDLSRGQAGRRSIPGISRANQVKEHAR